LTRVDLRLFLGATYILLLFCSRFWVRWITRLLTRGLSDSGAC
jgi:hypothetical protein